MSRSRKSEPARASASDTPASLTNDSIDKPKLGAKAPGFHSYKQIGTILHFSKAAPVDSTAKRNTSSKPEFDLSAKL